MTWCLYGLSQPANRSSVSPLPRDGLASQLWAKSVFCSVVARAELAAKACAMWLYCTSTDLPASGLVLIRQAIGCKARTIKRIFFPSGFIWCDFGKKGWAPLLLRSEVGTLQNSVPLNQYDAFRIHMLSYQDMETTRRCNVLLSWTAKQITSHSLGASYSQWAWLLPVVSGLEAS